MLQRNRVVGMAPGGKMKANAKQVKSVQDTLHNGSTLPVKSRIHFYSYFPILMTVMVYVKYVCRMKAADPD